MSIERRQLAGAVLTALMALAPLAVDGQNAPPGGEAPGNVFISPSGRPYRAKADAPYPIVDWFRKADADGDGRLTRAEFIADSMAFFTLLDRNSDGVISPQELAFYEQRIAPEVLGMRVDVGAGVQRAKPLIWRTQGLPGVGGMGGRVYQPESVSGSQTAPDPGSSGDLDAEGTPRSRPYDASGAGASPYSFFDEPEPVAAADVTFRGLVRKSDYQTLAEAHFGTLDVKALGYLTLSSLPSTPVQRRLERGHKRGH
jgi:hypothetical protein